MNSPDPPHFDGSISPRQIILKHVSGYIFSRNYETINVVSAVAARECPYTLSSASRQFLKRYPRSSTDAGVVEHRTDCEGGTLLPVVSYLSASLVLWFTHC